MASLIVDQPPAITASTSLTTTHPSPAKCRAPEEMHLSLTLALDAAVTSSITVNTRDTILTSNDFLWDRFLVVIDAETNEEIILPPSPSYWNTPHMLSVEQLQELSFPFSATSPVRHQTLTLRPGEKTFRTVIFKKSRLLERYQGLLVEGKRYKIVMKPGQTAQKWIWGDLEEATGPLCMDALSILDAGENAQFIFEGPTEEASSFTLPHCHIDM